MIGRRGCRWIGHTLHRNDLNIARQALRQAPQGQRRRPQMTWRRNCELEMTAKIEMVAGCLFMAYTLIGVKGNDDMVQLINRKNEKFKY